MVVGRWAAFGLVGGQAAAVDGNTIEDARQIVHDLFHTEKFAVSRRKRGKMEMPFAHLKRRPGFTHLRLRELVTVRSDRSAAARWCRLVSTKDSGHYGA